jgi:hypothetical protein
MEEESLRSRQRPMETGLRPALGAALFLTASLVAIAEIAAEPTAEAGVRSSTWTPLRGIWSLVAGDGAFGGTLDPGALGGLAILLIVAVALGLAGLGLIAFLLGSRPHPLAAMAVGVAWGLIVQILLIDLLVATALGHLPAYDALPHWAWWLGLGTWGAALGLLAAGAGRAGEPQAGWA